MMKLTRKNYPEFSDEELCQQQINRLKIKYANIGAVVNRYSRMKRKRIFRKAYNTVKRIPKAFTYYL